MNATDVAILGTGMSDMSRRDQEPDTLAYEVVHEALGDAGVSAHELGLVIMGNAMAGRLSDQGCVRGQTWLRKAGLSEVAIINVDNSCAGGSSSLHLATWRPPPRTARYWRWASRRCGPVTAPGRSPVLRTASQPSTATTCTTAATRTTIPPAAS